MLGITHDPRIILFVLFLARGHCCASGVLSHGVPIGLNARLECSNLEACVVDHAGEPKRDCVVWRAPVCVCNSILEKGVINVSKGTPEPDSVVFNLPFRIHEDEAIRTGQGSASPRVLAHTPGTCPTTILPSRVEAVGVCRLTTSQICISQDLPRRQL